MIIALKGPAQCGKTTLANVLDAEFQYRGFKVKRTAFSDFVRKEIAETYKIWASRFAIEQSVQPLNGLMGKDKQKFTHLLINLINEEVGDMQTGVELPVDILPILKTRPASASSRVIQQWWGQDFRRAQDPLYWIKQSFEANVEYLLDPDYIVIEESCRQENEGRYVHALGGLVLDLKPLAPPTESEAAAMSHSVEQAALSWQGDIEIDMSQFFAMEDHEQMKWTRSWASNLLRRWNITTV
jgi:hypothetical protein